MILADASLAELILAHPLTRPFALPISPLDAAVVSVLVILAVVFIWPERNHAGLASESYENPGGPTDSWSGPLSASQVVSRAAAVVLLLLAIAAGRLGVNNELENLAPALVVGVAWPMLPLLSIIAGRIWRWIDPWDGAARVLSRDESGPVSTHVWPALLPAVVWTWYLSVVPAPLSPRAVGAVVAAYTIFTLAGCLALGRVRWLSQAEPLGLILSWIALLHIRRLGRWDPPRGAEALLGVFAGGVLFGAVRRSELWGRLNVAPAALLYATVGLLFFVAILSGVLVITAMYAERRAARPAAARAAVPAIAAIIIAVAMDQNRLFTSLQLLPRLFGDPFGRGWDLLGSAGAGLDPAPLGVLGLALAQLTVLIAGHVTGAIVLARGSRLVQRRPPAIGLAILTGSSVLGLLAH